MNGDDALKKKLAAWIPSPKIVRGGLLALATAIVAGGSAALPPTWPLWIPMAAAAAVAFLGGSIQAGDTNQSDEDIAGIATRATEILTEAAKGKG